MSKGGRDGGREGGREGGCVYHNECKICRMLRKIEVRCCLGGLSVLLTRWSLLLMVWSCEMCQHPSTVLTRARVHAHFPSPPRPPPLAPSHSPVPSLFSVSLSLAHTLALSRRQGLV